MHIQCDPPWAVFTFLCSISAFKEDYLYGHYYRVCPWFSTCDPWSWQLRKPFYLSIPDWLPTQEVLWTHPTSPDNSGMPTSQEIPLGCPYDRETRSCSRPQKRPWQDYSTYGPPSACEECKVRRNVVHPWTTSLYIAATSAQFFGVE